jgi:hypothetical protein
VQRSTAERTLAQRRLDTVSNCDLRPSAAQVSVRAGADPQAAALGISSALLHVIQAGSMVALCLFSGLFISFGAGLIWRRS